MIDTGIPKDTMCVYVCVSTNWVSDRHNGNGCTKSVFILYKSVFLYKN